MKSSVNMNFTLVNQTRPDHIQSKLVKLFLKLCPICLQIEFLTSYSFKKMIYSHEHYHVPMKSTVYLSLFIHQYIYTNSNFSKFPDCFVQSPTLKFLMQGSCPVKMCRLSLKCWIQILISQHNLIFIYYTGTLYW